VSEPKISRRKLITTGIVAAAGAAGLGVADVLAHKYGLIPPDAVGPYGVSKTLTYAAQRILQMHHSLAREFDRSQISKGVIPVKGQVPASASFREMLRNGFADWRLKVDGMVARPQAFSLADLRKFPAQNQVTLHACEQGWSFIAEWTGVQLSYILNLVGISAQAKYVAVFSHDKVWDTLDMFDAWHPQTLLAYGMNGAPLPAPHGAPVRMRVGRQIGYKNVKFLSHLIVTDNAKQYGKGLGGKAPEGGWQWYAGI
jgi:DMSO/TMAO reductase YedYZ molybdopterin-dependent catalytic subunit